MLNALRLIQNVGQFDSFTGGERFPLSRLTVLYAENGRGKTTISAVVRSLASGYPVPINERRRLAAINAPHVIIECDGGPPPQAIFRNDTWSRTLPEVAIYDEAFVDANVYSGLVVDPAHRQRLHELILGAGGVRLNSDLQRYVARIEEHNRELRERTVALPEGARGGLSADAFCALLPRATIDADIQAAEHRLHAARQREPVRRTNTLPQLTLPAFDLPALERMLARDLPALDAEAAARVNAHIASLGRGAQDWLNDGVRFIRGEREEPCPFCGQDLSQSPLIVHYRSYFSEAYSQLRGTIADSRDQLSRTHGDAVMLEFEQAVGTLRERGHFWSQFAEIPDIPVDTERLTEQWRRARNAVSALVQGKLADPLARMEVDAGTRDTVANFTRARDDVLARNELIAAANHIIDRVKREAAQDDTLVLTRNLATLNAIRSRHSPDMAAICAAYLEAKAAKIVTEQARDATRAALERHRREVFPIYQQAINRYLERFNAGFRIEQVEPIDNRGGPSCTYSVAINNVRVPVGAGEPGQPSFRTTLSAGDRSALALAFFFASLDQDPSLRQKTVVIDDPISSMDAHRTLTTVQEVHALAERAAQVIVLSHHKPFLCQIWESAERIGRGAIEVARDGVGSSLRAWNVDADSETAHDRRHALLRGYLEQNAGNPRDVAAALRPTLEAFMRVACPAYFPAGSLLGPFIDTCRRRLESGATPILSDAMTRDLRQLLDYANRFHHDSNAAYAQEAINDQELVGFVRRTLDFARR